MKDLRNICAVSARSARYTEIKAAFTWDRYEIATDKPCVYTGSGGSGTDRICYLVPNGSTYEGDPIWNRTVPVSNRSRANRVDPYHSGSYPKRI